MFLSDPCYALPPSEAKKYATFDRMIRRFAQFLRAQHHRYSFLNFGLIPNADYGPPYPVGKGPKYAVLQYGGQQIPFSLRRIRATSVAFCYRDGNFFCFSVARENSVLSDIEFLAQVFARASGIQTAAALQAYNHQIGNFFPIPDYRRYPELFNNKPIRSAA